jgi:hypothetical protein
VSACRARTIPTAHCAEAQIARDISATDAWINQGTSGNTGFAKYAQRYKEYTDAPAGRQEQKAKEDAIRKGYRSRKVKVEGVSGEFTIANPYLARGVREAWVRDDLDVSGHPIIQENLRFARTVAPARVIDNKRLTMALLESMWHCGGQASLSDDPRCLPMRLLGEVREQEKVVAEEAKGEVPTAIAASWAGAGRQAIGRVAAALMPAATATAAAATPATPATAAAATPATPAATTPATTPAAATAAAPVTPAPDQTVPAPPVQIGGGTLRPLLPLMRLGRRQ